MSLKHRRGRTRTRARVEDAARVDALEFCRAHNLETVEKVTPTGDPFEVALCPTCKRRARWLYKIAPAVAQCRKCAGLVYRSKSESNSRAAKIRADPQAAKIAMNQISTALDTGDTAELDEGAHALQICATVTPPNDATAPDAEPQGDLSFAEVQNIIVRDDLKTATNLLDRVVSQLESATETHVNRRGDASQVAMRPDSVAKLVNAYATLSNLRANRAGIATVIHQTEQQREESGGGKTSAQLMAEHLARNDRETANGRSMRDLHARHEASMKQ